MARDVQPENYIQSPVDGFGKKIFEKLGWFEGRGVGKNSHGEVPLYFNAFPRSERLGLGAEDLQESVNKRKVLIGDRVIIIKGKHKGIIGIITDVVDSFAFIEISKSKNQLRISFDNFEIYCDEEKEKNDNEIYPKKRLR